jgi:H+/Cl- antiporter ClcA
MSESKDLSKKHALAVLAKSFGNYIQTHPAVGTVPYLVSALIAGLIAVPYAEVFTYVGRGSVFLSQSHPKVLLLFSPACFVVGWALVHFYAPEARGSGIPQVMAAHLMAKNGESEELHRLLSLKTAVVKVASSLFCVLGGGAIGREGPTVQISAAVFQAVGRRFERFRPNGGPQPWIVAGGAAGIAAAFNTPLGGVVYAIEELSTEHMGQFRTGLISAVVVAGLVSQVLLGPYLYLGYPVIGPASLSILPMTIAVGLLTGFFGGLFGKLLFILSNLRLRLKKSWQLLIVAALSGLLMSVLAMILGPKALGSGNTLISDLLSGSTVNSDWTWALARFVGSIVTYLSGCAGGIFAQSLSVGAAIGAQLAHFVRPQDANLMVLLGMIGFLSGVTCAPFTAFVLVLEMTDRQTAILPMMLSALLAYAAAKSVDSKSFYERVRETYQKSGMKSVEH